MHEGGTADTWIASSPAGVIGYYVYRPTVSEGPYTKLMGFPIAGTSCSDNNVSAGEQYYYVVNAVSSDGGENTYSNQVAIKVP